MGLKENIVSGGLDSSIANTSGTLAKWGGAFTAIYSLLESINWGFVIGASATIAGIVMSYYFNCRKENRERAAMFADERRKDELHAARLKALNSKCDI